MTAQREMGPRERAVWEAIGLSRRLGNWAAENEGYGPQRRTHVVSEEVREMLEKAIAEDEKEREGKK